MTAMMTIERAKGTAEDATDLSAKYRGSTGLPISVYGQEPGWVKPAPVRSRGTSAYFGMWSVRVSDRPLESCGRPGEAVPAL